MNELNQVAETNNTIWFTSSEEDEFFNASGTPHGIYVPYFLYQWVAKEGSKYLPVNNRANLSSIALIISELFKWSIWAFEKKNKYTSFEFYRSRNEWYERCLATRTDLEHTRALLTNAGLLLVNTKLAEGHPTNHWNMDVPTFRTVLQTWLMNMRVEKNKKEQIEREIEQKKASELIQKNKTSMDTNWQCTGNQEHSHWSSTASDRVINDQCYKKINIVDKQIDKQDLEKNNTVNCIILASDSKQSEIQDQEDKPPSLNLKQPVLEEIIPMQEDTYIPELEKNNSIDIPRPPELGKQTRPTVQPQAKSKLVKLSHEETLMLPVIEHWNSYPQIPDLPAYGSTPKLVRHKLETGQFQSKTVKEICEKLLLLCNGTFYKTYPQVQMYTPVSLLKTYTNYKFEPKTLMVVLDSYRDMFEPGVYPASKQLLKGSLKDCIGMVEHRRRGEQISTVDVRSWIWEVIHRGGELPRAVNLTEHEVQIETKHKDLIQKVCQAIIKSGNHAVPTKIVTVLAELKADYEYEQKVARGIYERINTNYAQVFASFETYANMFIDFVSERFTKDLYPAHFSIHGKMYSGWFKTYLKDVHKLLLRVNSSTAGRLASKRVGYLELNNVISENDLAYFEDGRMTYYTKSDTKLIEEGKIIPWWKITYN